jgi:hypothetical protein
VFCSPVTSHSTWIFCTLPYFILRASRELLITDYLSDYTFNRKQFSTGAFIDEKSWVEGQHVTRIQTALDSVPLPVQPHFSLSSSPVDNPCHV